VWRIQEEEEQEEENTQKHKGGGGGDGRDTLPLSEQPPPLKGWREWWVEVSTAGAGAGSSAAGVCLRLKRRGDRRGGRKKAQAARNRPPLCRPLAPLLPCSRGVGSEAPLGCVALAECFVRVQEGEKGAGTSFQLEPPPRQDLRLPRSFQP